MTIRLLITSALLLAAHTASAQVLHPLLPNPVVPQLAAKTTDSHQPGGRASTGGFLGPRDRDYRYEGFFAGLAIGGTWSIVEAVKCRRPCPIPPTVFVVGTSFLASLTGALLGGAISKSQH